MSRPLWGAMKNGVYVPADVAVCPECGEVITARAMVWDADTSQPVAASIELDCVADMNGDTYHGWWQSSWQPVRDAVVQWCKAREG